VKLIPIVVLVDDETQTRLGPIVCDVADRIKEGTSDAARRTMLLSGWTYEALAWGKVLAAVAADDIELDILDAR
jgi:hypothetical protein